MISQDAAELGIYASQLFRYVTEPQQTSVAELMLPIRDVVDDGAVVQTALEVGKSLLRSLASESDGEQRLQLGEVRRVVNLHRRMWDPEPEKSPAEVAQREVAVKAADHIQEWAMDLPADEECELRALALTEIDERARYLFKGKTLMTSNTLRLLAWRRYQSLGAA